MFVFSVCLGNVLINENVNKIKQINLTPFCLIYAAISQQGYSKKKAANFSVKILQNLLTE